jgi:hypothetical protein
MRLMFDVKYKGIAGELNLSNRPNLFYRSHSFMSPEWATHATPILSGRGSEITGFYKEMREYSLTLNVRAETEAGFYQLLNTLTDHFEADILAEKPGRLYVNDEYIICYITGSKKASWRKGMNWIEVSLRVLAPNPTWIRERKFSFMASGSEESDLMEGKSYPNAYPYYYVGSGASNLVENDSVSEALAIIVIYGYAKNPIIKIGERNYQVFETIQPGERIEINQMDRTVSKIYNTGQKENIFAKRGKVESVFAPIKPGRQMLSSSGGFGVDLTLHIERSEPRWK